LAGKVKDEQDGDNYTGSEEQLAEEVQKLHRELTPLEKERSDLNFKMKEKRQSFKAKTGMTLQEFAVARRYANLEDEGERDEKMKNLSIAYNALSSGEQLSWLPKEAE